MGLRDGHYLLAIASHRLPSCHNAKRGEARLRIEVGKEAGVASPTHKYRNFTYCILNFRMGVE